MKGVQAWDCSTFHPGCLNVAVVDVAGFKYLWCPDCRVLANLDAMAVKHQSLDTARKTGKGLGVQEWAKQSQSM